MCSRSFEQTLLQLKTVFDKLAGEFCNHWCIFLVNSKWRHCLLFVMIYHITVNLRLIRKMFIFFWKKKSCQTKWTVVSFMVMQVESQLVSCSFYCAWFILWFVLSWSSTKCNPHYPFSHSVKQYFSVLSMYVESTTLFSFT